MKACFMRKAYTLDELKEITDEGSEYVIAKTIELEPAAYREFSNDLLEDREFIEENIMKMYREYVAGEDIWHCLLIKAKGGHDGILVESEGYGYARYAAYCATC